MNESNIIKKKIINNIDQITNSKEFVLSTTIVGSFLNKGLESISDIDIVIIIDELNQQKFETVISEFKTIDSNLIGLNNFEVLVNSSFGPLKFDNEKTIVFHVMIYDVQGHIRHVEASPFTCHSWEQFQPINGRALSEIYPVVNLNISDLLDSRRGLTSYINDINKGIITYREYEFSDTKYIEKKKSFKLDKKHKLEYSYHIIYNLLNNFYKIVTQDKFSLSVEILNKFISDLNLVDKDNLNLLNKLDDWKNNKKGIEFDIMNEIKDFIHNFFKAISNKIKSSPAILFMRHQKTLMNDGTFLGVGRDPNIITFEQFNQELFERGYHSQLKRSRETIKMFNCQKLIETGLLNEIDYGKAEGYNINQLELRFPDLIKAWKNKKDPKFPNGESQKDVLFRAEAFLNEVLEKNKQTIVISHLVTLRLFLLKLIKIQLTDIYKIQIKHLEGFKFIFYENHLIPQFQEQFRKNMRVQLSKNNV